jgi:hypothetical protein
VVAAGVRAAQECERTSENTGRYKGKATDAQTRWAWPGGWRLAVDHFIWLAVLGLGLQAERQTG